MKKMRKISIFITLIIISYIFINSFHIRFLMADDYLLNNIITGAYGKTYDYQLLYVNNILGIILKLFYHIIPYVNIYTLFLVSILCSCYSTIINRIINSKRFILLPIIFILYLLTLFNITFTIIAYLSFGVGILELLFNNNKVNFTIILYIITGVLLRNDVMLPVLLVFGLIIIVQLIKNLNKKNVIYLSMLVILVVIINTIGNLAYEQNSILKNFRSWQHASSRIRDYTSIDYKKYKYVFEKVGWSENDLNLFYSWNFADSKKFSLQDMNSIVSEVKLKDRYNLNVSSIIKKYIEQYSISRFSLNEIYIILFFLSFLLAIITNKDKKTVLYVFLCTIGINLILIVRNRYPYRVVFPQYLIAIIYYLYVIIYSNNTLNVSDKLKSNKTKLFIMVFNIILCIIFSFTYMSKYKLKMVDYNNIEMRNNKVIEAFNKENLYILDSNTYNELTMNYIITKRIKIGYFDNVMKAGGGDCFSKRYYNYIKSYNLKYSENLYKNLPSNNVYYVGYVSDVLELYLKENVSETGKFEEYIHINDKVIYKYHK